MEIKTLSLMVLLGVVMAACTVAPAPEKEVSASQGVAEFSAPAFSVETTSGKTVEVSSSNERGKVVYFMASTCSSCAKNWEALNSVVPDYEGDVDFVAISVDPTDDAALLSELGVEKNFAFETVPGNPELAVKYDVKKQTAKFAIDRDGNIVSRHDGVLTEQEWRDLFDSVA